MKITSKILLIAALAAPSIAGAEARTLFSVDWGKGDAQIGYYNHTLPDFDQPYSEGPGGIALGPNGEIWISDTFNNRVLRFDSTGKKIAAVTALGGQSLQMPMALWLQGGEKICVIDSKAARVMGLDRVNDRLHLLQATQSPHQLEQPEAITGSAAGDLWVGDAMRSKFHHYDPSGKWLSEHPWQMSGLHAERDGTVYTLDYRDPTGDAQIGDTWLISYDAKGEKSDRVPLVAPELESPVLIGLDSAGAIYVRYRTSPPKDVHMVVKYDADGKRGIPMGEVPKTVTRQTFAVTPEGRVIGMSFDSKAAPAGKVDIVELTAP